MAVVKITKELINDVRKSIERLYKPKLDGLRAPQFAKITVELLLKMWAPSLRIIPDGWMPYRGGVDVKVYAGGEYPAAYTDSYNLKPKQMLPFMVASNIVGLSGVRYEGATMGDPDVVFNTSSIDGQNHPLWDVARDIDRHHELCSAVIKERDKSIDAVGKLLGSVTTLAPALRAYPALWDLLPQYTKDKHTEVVVRSSGKAATVADVDLTQVTSILTTNKMMGNK